MSKSQYQAFLTTIEKGSLTAAANELGYTQSGITHLLNALEDEMGLRLIVREKSGAYPTAEGLELIPYFRDIIASYGALEERVKEIHNLEGGLIRIATFTSVSVQWLPGMIAAFQKDHPGIEFELLHGSHHDNMVMLEEGRCDLSFVASIDEKNLPDFVLYRDPLVAVAQEKHPLVSTKKVKPKDLEKYPFIKLSDDAYNEALEISGILNRHDVNPGVRFTEMNDYAVVAMVEKNLGVSLLPAMSVRRTSRKIAARPLSTGDKRIIGITVKDINKMSAASKEFIQYAKRWVEEEFTE